MKLQEAIRNDNVWKKVKKYGLKPLAWIGGAIFVIWAILWLYVVFNEDSIKQRIGKAIHSKTRGDVKIGSLSVSFFRTFPLLSLQLTDVTLRDSVTAFPHKDFLKASDIYLRVSVPGLITGNAPVGKILMRNGEINIMSDSTGNTNEYIFQIKKREGRPPRTTYPVIELQNVSGHYKDPERNKEYSAIFHSLKCYVKDGTGVLSIDLNTKMLARKMAFNSARGAYLKNKMVEGRFKAALDRKTKILNFQNVKLLLDNHPYYFTGQFNVDKSKADFALSIISNKVNFNQAASLLTEKIKKSLEPFSLTNPVNLVVKLAGKTKFRTIPLVEASMEVKGNKVMTPKGMFEDCSFNGFFSNELIKGKPREDENSYLHFKNFTGSWENITLKSKEIKISNLIKPFIQCDVASEVDLKTLDKLADSETFQFLEGKTSFSIAYKGPMTDDDTSAANINGYINIANASIKYTPRNLLLSDCDGNLKFVNNDLELSKLNADVGDTKLSMKGSATNFLSLLNVSPEKLVLTLKINSPELHLADFKSLLSSSQKKKIQEKKNSTIARASSRIDRMFSEGDMYISLESPSMDYKTFLAKSVKANVVFKPSEIRLDQVSLSHAGGSMNVKGALKNGTQYNPVLLHVHMYRMDIPELFRAFDNFGQDAVTHSNMKGRLSAEVIYNTGVTNKAELVAAGSEGSVNFLLEEGELINFEPLQEIAKKLKKQDFTHVRFADLKNRLDIKGNTFIVNPMDIRSTALNFSVEGVYDPKKGTDMSIKLPFRNLLKSQANTDISDQGKPARGMGLRLRAKTGDDGKLKVSWDPLKLAVKNREDVRDSSDLKN